jgi:uncharacterized SAM-binding protein YcdF (DUF218 family)
MFFLSKFLPVFVYPLGLVCLLVGTALVLLLLPPRRFLSPRLPLGLLGTAVMLLWTSSMPLVAKGLARSLEWQHLPPREVPAAGAIVVLGGGTRPWIAPRPWYELNEAGDRILHGARLYRAGKAPLLIVSGGRVAELAEGGNPEAEDMAAIAQLLGVPLGAIIQETASRNTYENALGVQKVLQERQINDILLVTSAFHMPRSLRVFTKLGIKVTPAPADFLAVQPNEALDWSGWILDCLPTAEAQQVTNLILKEYVGLWVYQLRGWAA